MGDTNHNDENYVSKRISESTKWTCGLANQKPSTSGSIPQPPKVSQALISRDEKGCAHSAASAPSGDRANAHTLYEHVCGLCFSACARPVYDFEKKRIKRARRAHSRAVITRKLYSSAGAGIKSFCEIIPTEPGTHSPTIPCSRVLPFGTNI